MSDVPQGEGWWKAVDGRWYSPEQHPDYVAPPPPPPPPPPSTGSPGPGYWLASDGQWYPPQPSMAQAYPTAVQSDTGDRALRMVVPVGRSGWAIAAGYLGLVSWIIIPLAPFAILCAELGRREIAKNPKKHGMGRVVTGFVGGAIGMCFILGYLLWWVGEVS